MIRTARQFLHSTVRDSALELFLRIKELEKRMNKMEKKMTEKFIQKAIKHPGALRKSLHVKKGEKIPAAKLKKAEHSKNPTTRKRAVLAETLKKMHQ